MPTNTAKGQSSNQPKAAAAALRGVLCPGFHYRHQRHPGAHPGRLQRVGKQIEEE